MAEAFVIAYQTNYLMSGKYLRGFNEGNHQIFILQCCLKNKFLKIFPDILTVKRFVTCSRVIGP